MLHSNFDLPNEAADSFELLRQNEPAAQKVIHMLVGGKHIDPYAGEEYRFLEDYHQSWECFFQFLGYTLKRSELGGEPFFYLEPRSDLVPRFRLSRGATFLGLYLAWHFFMQGPGEPDRIGCEDVFGRLVASYPHHLLRSVFIRKPTGQGSLEFSEDQAQKLRGAIRKEAAELCRYRFIDVKPNARAAWEDLTIYRLPALYRFWELALHVQDRNGNGRNLSINGVIEEVWGSLEADPDEEAQP